MSTNQVVLFDAPQLPAILLNQAALALGKDLVGGLGSGVNRISLKGNRFRLVQAGQEIAVLEQSTLDVVIIGSTPSVSRIYYKDKYNGIDKVKPTCWSKDGIKPDNSVPADAKQSVACASCHQNIKGSAVGDNGVQSRACAFRKRIVVVAPSQLGTGEAPEAYALDVNALSLFGDGDPGRNHYGLGGYGKFLSTPRTGFPSGIPPIAVITRLSLDSNSSVPKLFFGVSTNEGGRAAFLNEHQINEAIALSKTEAVIRLVDASTDELLTPEASETAPVASPARAPVAAPAAPVAPPPPPKVATWQEVAEENGADEDDIELIEAAGGPYTEKGYKRWGQVVTGVEPPANASAPAAPAVDKPKRAKAAKAPMADGPVDVEAKPAKNPFGAPVLATAPAEVKKNPFGAAPAPAPASAPAKPQGVTAAVGAKLADALSGFDDE